MKPEWGTKHECLECGAHFYDMRKPECCCPKCGTPANDEATLQAKTQNLDDPPPKAEDPDPLDDFEDVETDVDDEDAFLEDAEDLDGGDDILLPTLPQNMNEEEMDQNI